MTTTQQLANIRTEIDEARRLFNASKPGSKVWRQAGDDLDWLTGKAAALQHSIDLGI